jgi:iron complex outermembrane receptor protein
MDLWSAEPHSAPVEKDTVELVPKVVTVNKAEIDALDAAASFSTISGETLRNRDVRVPAEALKGMSNVQVLEHGEGNWTQVIIRGVPHPHGNNNVLVLVDGIPTLMSSDEANLNAIPFDDIERVEVIKGLMSALYGRNAVGGTVNYITRKAPSRLQGEGTLAYGSDHYFKPTFRLGGPTGAANNFFSIGGYWLGYDGWRNDADRNAISLYGKDQWYYSSTGNIQVSANYHDNEQSVVSSIPVRPDGSVVQLAKGNTYNYDIPPGANEKFYTAQGQAALSQQLGGGFDLKLTAQYRKTLRKY